MQKLVNHYNLLTKDCDDTEKESQSIAASGCIRAIVRILEAVSTDIPLVKILRAIAFPIVEHALLKNYE